MPIITLEVMPESSNEEMVPYDSYYPETQKNNAIDDDMQDSNGIPFLIDKNGEATGMHFLVDNSEPTEVIDQNTDKDANSRSVNVRTDLLEYTTLNNGSVCCKICGKVLASRTHWYRHKHRAHAMLPVNPAPLFQCEQCLIYFKSRKGYIGHISSKHSETLKDASPVLTNAQAEALAKEKSIIQAQPIQLEPKQPETFNQEPTQADPIEPEVKKEPDPELAIPKTIVAKFQPVPVKQTTTRNTDSAHKRSTRSSRSYTRRSVDELTENAQENERDRKERCSREEKLVADIIARVRRECEVTGGPTRRGYSRKTIPRDWRQTTGKFL